MRNAGLGGWPWPESRRSPPRICPRCGRSPQQTAEVLRDGWYHTGDAGSVDDEGFLYVRDRYKDMIISGGENVYPAEVESAMLELADVQEVAVIGVPDPTWGEVGLAVVVPSPGTMPDPEELRTRLRTRLAAFKVPHRSAAQDRHRKIRKPDLRDRFVTTEENPA